MNNALDAIVSNNSGSSEPSTTFAYEWWIDTSANVLKLRNSANNAWITLPLSITADNSTSGGLTVNGNLSTTGTLDVNGGEVILDADADTSITADTDDQIDFRVGAVDVMTLTNSHLVLKGTTPKITIGDGGAEDTALIFDGNAQDFYIGLDDTDDFLKIGTGSTIGTNTLVTIENGGNVGINCDPVGTFQIKTQADGNAAFQNSTSVTGGVKINCFNDAANASSPFEIDGSSLQFNIASTEKMRLSSSGFLGIGLTAPQHEISVGSTSSADASVSINGGTSSFPQVRFNRTSAESGEGRIFYDCSNNALAFMANGVEGLRLLSTGSFLVGKTSDSFGATGGRISSGGSMTLTANGNELMNLNRLTNDGALIYFSRDSSIIGTISVSSGFVTYGNFMGSHYTETAENEILLGTVMEFTGDLVEDKFTTGKHLSKAKISDSEESKNVYGVYFANHEDETGELISSLGASFCRINKDVTVEIGDLLVSNGDGTAKVQDDDLIKSKTIGKVTSTQKRDIYDDGSYTIPVVLYCG